MPATKKSPKCVRGYNCGRSCIARNRSCVVALEGQAKNYAEWLQARVDTGDALSDTHKGDAEARGIKAANKTPKLPDGVEKYVSSTGYKTTYSFSIGREYVEMGFQGFRNQGRSVYFVVNGGNEDDSRLSPDEKALTARRLSQIFEYEVSQSPDGALYECDAFTDDGGGYKRATAYMRMGFSMPQGGVIGRNQVAVVKNGRFDKEATEEYSRNENDARDSHEEAVQRWTATVEAEQARRNQARRDRRSRSTR